MLNSYSVYEYHIQCSYEKVNISISNMGNLEYPTYDDVDG